MQGVLTSPFGCLIDKPFEGSCLNPIPLQRDVKGRRGFSKQPVFPLGLKGTKELTQAWVLQREEVTCPRSPSQSVAPQSAGGPSAGNQPWPLLAPLSPEILSGIFRICSRDRVCRNGVRAGWAGVIFMGSSGRLRKADKICPEAPGKGMSNSQASLQPDLA